MHIFRKAYYTNQFKLLLSVKKMHVVRNSTQFVCKITKI